MYVGVCVTLGHRHNPFRGKKKEQEVYNHIVTHRNIYILGRGGGGGSLCYLAIHKLNFQTRKRGFETVDMHVVRAPLGAR